LFSPLRLPELIQNDAEQIMRIRLKRRDRDSAANQRLSLLRFTRLQERRRRLEQRCDLLALLQRTFRLRCCCSCCSSTLLCRRDRRESRARCGKESED
jgi:hypothetical protein